MPIQNAYNPQYKSIGERSKQLQTRYDLAREQGLIKDEPEVPVQNQRVLGVEMTPDSPDKSFLRKVGEDAAMLAYAIPVGLAKVATGLVTHPIDTLKELGGGFVQSVKDVVDADYYKAHPLLGVVNLAGFVSPIAGIAKSTAVKSATNTAYRTAIREASLLGVDEALLTSAVKPGVFSTVVKEAAKTGRTEIVSEVVRSSLLKAGVADEVALRIGSSVADNLYSNLSRQTTKLKVMETLAHPVGSGSRVLSNKLQPLRKALFGSPAETAVARLYGTDVVSKNPEGFLSIERWAEAQVKERGLENSVSNRQRIMQEWVEQNSQWASLTPEQRVAHFKNYAEQDLIRLQIHNQTGIDIVTTKALPQNYVDAMVQTVKDTPVLPDGAADVQAVLKVLEDTFGNDFTMHSAEITKALTKNASRDAIIAVVSKLGNARSNVSFAKFAPEIQVLAKSLEKSGYRIGYAPTNKEVSFATDVFAGASKEGVSAVATPQVLAKRTALGAWLDRMGLSARGVVEGAAEFSYRENFTQRALNQLAPKYGNIIKAGAVSIPVEKLFEWIDKNKTLFSQARPRGSFPIRTVFDVKADDLIRAGFLDTVANEIAAISKKALREVPTSITGMGDALIDYLRTGSARGFDSFSKWYDRYLKLAYLGRYDYSPFFSMQQFLETKIQASMLIKDSRLVPGVKAISKLGTWTAEKLGKRLEGTASYLRKIIDEPPIEEVALVREEVLGSLQKTMLDYSSSPDLISVQNAAKGGLSTLKDKAIFEQSIKSRNFWYRVFGQSSVRMASTFNKALAEKFGMSITDALAYTYENGVKRYKNPQIVQMMREATQMAFHYKEGFLTSPLMKTLNIVWFPLRFQAKTMQLMGRWMNSLSPMQRMTMMNNWVHFANWSGTDEGIEWRRTNRNMLYNIFAYTTAFEQIGQSLEAVTKGRLFGGNAGLIGGVPFGVMVNIARELAILPEDPDQFDPKTGRRFTKETPREIISAASLSSALEQLIISISPSTPFYSLTGGVISGVSPRKYIESLMRQVVGAGRAAIEGRDPARGKQDLERDFKRVPLEYNRLTE